MMTDENNELIKEAIRKVMRTNTSRPKAKARSRQPITVNHETLSERLLNLAELIEQGNNVYLPIFERVLREMEQREHFKNIKAVALELAAGSVDDDETD